MRNLLIWIQISIKGSQEFMILVTDQDDMQQCLKLQCKL